jgi:DNA invertase Pin-like site-specific DNA recombinase
MRYGYARVSTEEQNLDRQIEALTGMVDRLICEKVSGKQGSVRVELDKLISRMKAGDELVVYSIDRFSRSVSDFTERMKQVRERGASVFVFDIKMGFGNSAFGDALIQILMVFAELERKMTLERMKPAIARAKEQGLFRGRKPVITDENIEQVLQMRKRGMTLAKIGKKFNVSAAAIHSAIARHSKGKLATKESLKHWTGETGDVSAELMRERAVV